MKTIFDTQHAVRYISHRGFMPLAPENSIAGFEYSGLLSQWAIETDVRVARDGTLVCCHDADVSRMFGLECRVEDMTWDELSHLRFCHGSRLECLPENLRGREYYHPSEMGSETHYRKRLENIKSWKSSHKRNSPSS